MEIEPLEVYSRTSNYAIIKPPGRNYPGCVIQGDSLAILCGMAKDIAASVQNRDISSKDFRNNVQELTNSLVSRILHYQQVLVQHGLDFPHTQPFSEKDLVNLVSDNDGE
jgi:hypothetical protein